MDIRRHPGRLMSLDQYLAFEAQSSIRHEYVAGEAYAMRGAARAQGCRVFAIDVKLRVGDRVYYPDLMLACGRAAEVEQIVEEPSLVVEVTSPGTRATDRREKLESSRKIPSLGLYLIVDQRRRHVLAYIRDAAGDWLCEELAGEGEIPLRGLRDRVSLADLYDGVELPPLTLREEETWDEYGEDEAGDL